MKLVKNIFWFFAPLLLSIFILVLWVYLFGAFRSAFDFPWGNDGQNFSATNWKQLAIFNGVQFIFILCLFLATIYVYNWCRSKVSITGDQRWWYLFLISISWTVFCFIADGLANFTCCPGMIPNVFNSLWWLTDQEFIFFYVLGQIYLIGKIIKLSSSKQLANLQLENGPT